MYNWRVQLFQPLRLTAVQRKEKEKLELLQKLENERKENSRMKELLKKSQCRFDKEYKALSDELRRRNDIQGSSR